MNNRTIKQGEQFTINLQGNASSGFAWVATTQPPGIVAVSNSIEAKASETNIAGSPAIFTFSVEGEKCGTATITFEYKRPWESKAKPLKQESIKVKVIE
ncbi:protease inhibitor I42 family protein [Foetidibacter luteolus]|uniref:protease inhibitor I42 family protein n=1 Tax=Foetidibacter luteolus TaxID=2608880 RepID=UPI00129B59D7|nr:protease inhibitor I42 family protein [Foetidibacter luteolus]